MISGTKATKSRSKKSSSDQHKEISMVIDLLGTSGMIKGFYKSTKTIEAMKYRIHKV